MAEPNSPRPKSKYGGVSWESRKGKWKARIKIGDRTQHFLYSDEELACAWTSDFVRYMLFGTDYHKWPGKSLKPNYAPCRFERVDRHSIVQLLLARNLIHPNVMANRLIEYDRIAEFLRPTMTDSTPADDTPITSTPITSTTTDSTANENAPSGSPSAEEVSLDAQNCDQC